MARVRRIGVMTGGGDAPGLNAVIRSVVKASWNHGIGCLGLEDSFNGLIEDNRTRLLTPADVTGILRQGGTILGTTNRGNPFAFPTATPTGIETTDVSQRCVDMFHQLGLDALVVIGGDGTLAIAYEFFKRGIPIVGIPKTIDNDIVGTTSCFGFDSAVSFATDAIDRLHTTAEAHHRVIAVEVMGRYAGWIGLYAGIAGGADVILIPEIPFDLRYVAEHIKQREKWGARSSIVVVAEGAAPVGGKMAVVQSAEVGRLERLGGMAQLVAADLEKLTGKELRAVVLGHLQRGGAPTSFDRQLATRFGSKAVELLVEGDFGKVVVSHPPDIDAVPLEDVVGKIKHVPLQSDMIRTARAVGIHFGEAPRAAGS